MKAKNKNFLEKYKNELITAYFHKYVRNLPMSVLMEIERLIEDETSKSLKTNFGCGACVLKLMQAAAKKYFTDYPDELSDDLKDKFKK